MTKIKFITDTSCDIPDADLAAFHIDMLSVPVAVDGEEFYERKSFTIPEFYKVLGDSKEIPKTSRVPQQDFLESYETAWEQGYTHIFCVTINASGSGTNDSAQGARKQFYHEHPEAEHQISIDVINSKTYAMAFGLPVLQAAEKAAAGASVGEVKAFLEDCYRKVEIFLGCYTLEYAKKSGRISTAAAFVGDMLGMRPIIHMVDGETSTIAKVRGNSNIAPKVFEYYRKNRTSKEDEVWIIYGSNEETGKEIQKLVEKDIGRKIPAYQLGASIAINAGPEVVAIVLKGNERKEKN